MPARNVAWPTREMSVSLLCAKEGFLLKDLQSKSLRRPSRLSRFGSTSGTPNFAGLPAQGCASAGPPTKRSALRKNWTFAQRSVRVCVRPALRFVAARTGFRALRRACLVAACGPRLRRFAWAGFRPPLLGLRACGRSPPPASPAPRRAMGPPGRGLWGLRLGLDQGLRGLGLRRSLAPLRSRPAPAAPAGAVGVARLRARAANRMRILPNSCSKVRCSGSNIRECIQLTVNG